MPRQVRSIRRGILALAFAASMALGAWAVWHFAPRAFTQLRTGELAGLVGLLVLPGLTLLAIVAERRQRREHGAGVEQRPEARRVIHEPAVEHRRPQARSRSVDLDALRP